MTWSERILRRVVWLVVSALWLVAAVLIFIPFLFRAVLFYTGLILLSMVTPQAMARGERELDRVIRFWPEGLRRVNGILHRPTTEARFFASGGLRLTDVALVLGTVISCVLFWTGVSWVAGKLFGA